MKKLLALLMTAALVLTLGGCSSGEEKESANTSLRVVVAAAYVDDDMLAGMKEELDKAEAGVTVEITGVTMSDSQTDPMGFMAGVTRLSGSIAAGEVDILITDADNARRMGDNGEGYLAINDTFTSSEIEKFTSGLACVSIVDDDGELTGEVSAPCGAVLSENANALMGLSGMQMFIVANTAQYENAKTVFQYLAAL